MIKKYDDDETNIRIISYKYEMKSIRPYTKLGLLFLSLMVIFLPFSCEDKNECLDLYVEPYYDIQSYQFIEVDLYSYVQGKFLDIRSTDQDYANTVYPCDSLAMYYYAEVTFHSQNTTPWWQNFSLLPKAYACNSLKPGYQGTLEQVQKITISSNYDFDEMHKKDDDLSDIVDIFAYSKTGSTTLMKLSDYNAGAPYPAPFRFYLLIKRKPTKSNTQQFVVKYYMKSEIGEPSEYYIVRSPVLQVR